MKKYVFWTLVVFTLAGCGNEPEQAAQGEIVVKGKVMLSQQETLYLEELLLSKIVMLDSCRINENGEFYFKVMAGSPGFYVLKQTDANSITTALSPGETAEFSIYDVHNMRKQFAISGSSDAEKMKILTGQLMEDRQLLDSIAYEISSDTLLPKREIVQRVDSLFNRMYLQTQAFVKAYIETNASSLPAIYAFYQTFRSKRLIEEDEQLRYAEIIDKVLFEALPGNLHAEDFHNRLAEMKRISAEQKIIADRVKIGAIAPDFALPAIGGDTVRLSSLRGKTVLLDFWASWCDDCAQEISRLKYVYNKYKNQGFKIYSVSLDNQEEPWRRAVKSIGTDWVQVSDLSDFRGPVAKLYNIQALPQWLLLDEQGVIVAKGVRVEELAEILKGMFTPSIQPMNQQIQKPEQ